MVEKSLFSLVPRPRVKGVSGSKLQWCRCPARLNNAMLGQNLMAVIPELELHPTLGMEPISLLV